MDILISEELVARNYGWLQQKYSVVHDPNLWQDRDKLSQTIREARAIMVRNQTQITTELLATASKLIAVGRLGVGLDNIDVEAASKLGIVVLSPLQANAISVAELALGLMLSLARKIPYADRSTKAGGWDRKGTVGIELAGKTLGICGFGRIGRLVATRARAFEMRVLVFDPMLAADAPVFSESGAIRKTSLEELLAEADIVTIHAPLTPDTKHLFNQRTFAAMRLGAFLVNTSRGGLVDEEALNEVLQSGRLGGAALDVRETEPPKVKLGFETMDNVILLPHAGASTVEAQARTFDTIAADIDRLLQGQPAVNFVNFAQPRR